MISLKMAYYRFLRVFYPPEETLIRGVGKSDQSTQRALQNICRSFPYLDEKDQEQVLARLDWAFSFQIEKMPPKISKKIWFNDFKHTFGLSQSKRMSRIWFGVLENNLSESGEHFDDVLIDFLLNPPKWETGNDLFQQEVFSLLQSSYREKGVSAQRVLNFFEHSGLRLDNCYGIAGEEDQIKLYLSLMRLRPHEIKDKDWSVLACCQHYLPPQFFEMLQENGVDVLQLLKRGLVHYLDFDPSKPLLLEEVDGYLQALKKLYWIAPQLIRSFEDYVVILSAKKQKDELFLAQEALMPITKVGSVLRL
jgi:hypothetical protein